jgi:hypothetical protein
MVSAYWYDISQLWVSILISNISNNSLNSANRSGRSFTVFQFSSKDKDSWFAVPGIYLVLFCICMHILLHRPSSRGNTVLLVTAIVLFTLSTVLTVLNLVLGTAEIDEMASIPYQKVQDTAFIVYAINKWVYIVNSNLAQTLILQQFHR